jgi:hypothetical protein
MSVPEPLSRLYQWIEASGFHEDAGNRRYGYLFSQPTPEEEEAEEERPGGTMITFSAEGNKGLEKWFGHNRSEVIERLCVFARTGGDGSRAALWLAPDGCQRIVHLGSGSGSTLACVLADDAIDFLRLLAFGYDEICWSARFTEPPNASLDDDEVFVHPNLPFQDWVGDTFSTTIPLLASEVVRQPSLMDDVASDDLFWNWRLR